MIGLGLVNAGIRCFGLIFVLILLVLLLLGLCFDVFTVELFGVWFLISLRMLCVPLRFGLVALWLFV